MVGIGRAAAYLAGMPAKFRSFLTQSCARWQARLAQAVAALLLAMIAVQAIAPGPVTFHTERGSAFSALTADVSLAPRQAEHPAKRLSPLPDPLPTLPSATEPALPQVIQPHPAALPVPPARLALSPRERPEVPASPRDPPRP